ncbi:hypothetical protein KQX54_005944 [Cotesia glomerata]|uniref:Uncharacterized protein n=1 Tax=Cotesia glomerata TaxID=32391 RepID=A0AAV7J725_COTGL|nr:hypothetical protein KQX54_005944 [Cotesia glomerata]
MQRHRNPKKHVGRAPVRLLFESSGLSKLVRQLTDGSACVRIESFFTFVIRDLESYETGANHWLNEKGSRKKRRGGVGSSLRRALLSIGGTVRCGMRLRYVCVCILRVPNGRNEMM